MARKTSTDTKPKGSRKTAQQRGGASSTKRGSRTPTVAAISIGAAVLAGGAALLGIFAKRREGIFAPGNAEHEAPDLALDAPRPGTDRAPDAFRPDPTAPVPESEREGLRPATGPAPTLVKGQADELRRVDAAPS